MPPATAPIIAPGPVSANAAAPPAAPATAPAVPTASPASNCSFSFVVLSLVAIITPAAAKPKMPVPGMGASRPPAITAFSAVVRLLPLGEAPPPEVPPPPDCGGHLHGVQLHLQHTGGGGGGGVWPQLHGVQLHLQHTCGGGGGGGGVSWHL